ncbi:ribbon-helix-helix protein, CopG family [Sandaracinobacteroides saxicola]|uniref:CopG family transcriptional regulator n=1 Tax=Sandaracinobacteroides saxicola TaxID=2759707 RepID=A0A7G5IK76_9SPHN|nr:ribbon-helix-helix protein, CopG family [Sandaracinobacteroides saxicola]QMW23768.1 CopG family transcriptional regulator [Sandaracinobacteroides saxicola]
MLGLRLDAATEKRLAQHAAETRRTRSDIARVAVREYLDRHSEDAEWERQLATLRKAREARAEIDTGGDGTKAWLRSLDAMDGGYDWGPNGPPA